tara:strand:- start:11160 stop:11381 length:222 start_codon:yes stop_codon:yes gene_type:complete
MKISEQPGRFFAILLFAPYLIYCGYKYKDPLLFFLGIIFIIYELFWVIFFDPKNINIRLSNNNDLTNVLTDVL